MLFFSVSVSIYPTPQHPLKQWLRYSHHSVVNTSGKWWVAGLAAFSSKIIQHLFKINIITTTTMIIPLQVHDGGFWLWFGVFWIYDGRVRRLSSQSETEDLITAKRKTQQGSLMILFISIAAADSRLDRQSDRQMIEGGTGTGLSKSVNIMYEFNKCYELKRLKCTTPNPPTSFALN